MTSNQTAKRRERGEKESQYLKQEYLGEREESRLRFESGSAPCSMWDLGQTTAALGASVYPSGRALCGLNKITCKARPGTK